MKAIAKQALIIGATGGIGREITERLYKMGFDPISAGRDPKKLMTLTRILGSNATYFVADITNYDQIHHGLLMHRDRRRKDGLENNLQVVVNASGVLRLNDSLESLEQCIDVNLIGTHNTLKLAEEFIEDDGHVGVISSAASLLTLPGKFGSYAASKAAVNTLCNHARISRALRVKNVSVTVSYPQIVETAMANSVEAKEHDVFKVFPHYDPKVVAKKIVDDMLTGKRSSFLSRRDQLLAFVARVAPVTFERLTLRYIEQKLRTR